MRKAVIVTGASRGLGRAVALKFGREGWNVIVNFFASREKAEETVRGITNSGGDAFSIKADVRSYPEVEAMAAEALSRFGRLDVLINSAGITGSSLIIKLDAEGFQGVLDTNLKGCFNTIKAVSRPMTKQRSGHIINISSIQGVRGKAGQAAYAASKAGLIGLTKAAAVELAPRGIRVNAVLPGYMLTDMGAGASDKAKDEALRDNLLKRYSEPGEVADFIFHLAGMNAVSGQVFNLDSRII
jgi:3-oxoacyl-[acyl-carrier protein] reductase